MANKERSNSTNLYVKNFGKELDESKLCQLFSVYGRITSCKIPTDESGQSKGFGYVNFERPEMADEAKEKLNGHRLKNGNHLYVGPFQKKSERQQDLRRFHQENLTKRADNLCLYVSNMDMMIDEKILEAIFSKFGQVTKTHVMRNGSQSKGVGFVCFTTIEDTNRALNEMNGKWIFSKPIYVRLSRTKDEASNASTPIPQLYSNIPPVVCIPTMGIPHPPIVRPQILPVPLLSLIPTPPPLPSLIRPSNEIPRRELPYPYNRIESDD